MAFRVFAPAEIKGAAEERLARESLRANNIAKATRELHAMREEAERMFEETLKSQQETADGLRKEEEKKRASYEKEVAVLEERKRAALAPILQRERDAVLEDERLKKLSSDLEEKRADIEEKYRLLMERLDDISFKEQEIEARDKRSNVMRLGVQQQARQVSEDSQRLSVELAKFQKYTEEQSALLAMRESAIVAQEKMNKEKVLMFEKREKEIEDGNIVLTDRRATLEQGFEELRRLKKSHGN